jgi:hypothetical protein
MMARAGWRHRGVFWVEVGLKAHPRSFSMATGPPMGNSGEETSLAVMAVYSWVGRSRTPRRPS